MCLAVPARVTRLNGLEAEADLHGNRVPISCVLTPDINVGDWVLVHAGFAFARLDEKQAAETWSILDDLARLESSDARQASEISSASGTSSASSALSASGASIPSVAPTSRGDSPLPAQPEVKP